MTAEPGVPSRGERAAQGIVLATGCFGLVAQILVFRDFLAAFEGNELGIAWFFASWLVWVAAGALGLRAANFVADRLVRHFEFLPLLYIPAYLLQSGLTVNARALAGIETFELFPLVRMLPVSFMANAPVSICTGILFTLGCRWLGEKQEIPVARVYMLDALGGAAGGLAATILLTFGAAPETLFLVSALLVSLVICIFRILARTARWSFVPVAILLILIVGRADRRWHDAKAQRAWKRVMRDENFIGTFTTPHAAYHFGHGNGQFNVVARQTVVDTLPDQEHASEVAAIHLAQRPAARRFVVIGPGTYSICRKLLELEQTDLVTWLDTDPDYPGKLLSVLPADLKKNAERLDIPGIDVRDHLAQMQGTYDVAIINLPDITTLAMNRYFTVEFFAGLAEKLAANGLVGVRTPGAENYIGGALANTGAVVHQTLGSVFPSVVLKPGAETWLLASGGELSMSPAELRDRFATIAGAPRLYPPQALMTLYVPDRIAYQQKAYADALKKHGAEMLLNTDRKPKALLYGLLFAAKQAGTGPSLGRFIAGFARSGTPVIPLAILLYVLTRLAFMIGHRGAGHRATGGTFDLHAMVAASGSLAMGVNLVLMFMYQAAFGSIFLHVGLISALFMVGLSLAAAGTERVLARRAHLWRVMLAFALVCHLFFVTLLCTVLPHSSRPVFTAAFFLAGLLSGIYVPVAASRSRELGIQHLLSGSAIEMADHAGGAVGGLVVGLLLIPAFGSVAALCTVALLLSVNALPLLRWSGEAGTRTGADRFETLNRPIGYALTGVALFFVVAGLLIGKGAGHDVASAFRDAVRVMGGGTLQHSIQQADASGTGLRCVMFGAGKDEVKYFVCSDRSAPDIAGYGGPVIVAAMLDAEGTILDLRLVLSNETPSYVAGLGPWFDDLKGRRIHELGEVDAATGATLTSSAVLTALKRTGKAFAGNVIGIETGPADVAEPAAKQHRTLPPILALIAALCLRRKPGTQLRRLFLLLVAAVLGVALNHQYSLAHVVSLAALRLPSPGLHMPFLLTAGVPLLVLLFGNIYCGYLCPFGAAQELIGELRPASVPTTPVKSTWRYGRSMKYLLLFVLVTAFALSRRQGTASCDPLVTAFSRAATGPVGFTLLVLALAFPFRRFWCRNLCPAGAFLALLSRARLVRRLAPKVAVKSCDLGVESDSDLDCISCDRCRSRRKTPAVLHASGRTAVSAVFIVCVLVAAMLLIGSARDSWSKEHTAANRENALPSGGRARDVDMRRIHGLIEAGRLSGHEARHYSRAGEREQARD